MSANTHSYRSQTATGLLDFAIDFADGRWHPGPATSALNDIAVNLHRTRRLQLSLGPFEPGLPLKDGLRDVNFPHLAELHLQSDAPLELRMPESPGLLRLSLSGVQPREWSPILSDRLTHLELSSLVIPLSELRSCLLYSQELTHVSLSQMAVIIDQPRVTPVPSPNLISLRLRLSDARSTLTLLDMLSISHIRHVHVALPYSPCDTPRILETLVHLPVHVKRLRLEGSTLVLGDGEGHYLRRLEKATPAAIQQVLQHLKTRRGLCDNVEDVALDIPNLQLVASVLNSFSGTRRLHLKVADGNALRGYVAGRHRISFPGLQALDIDAKRVSRITSPNVLNSFMASLDARHLKRVDGVSYR
ncbi:hypothetical protein AURDEDRAFT_168447 [Auricularia subglabra TFB-10046 SS5]|nr:hypothetical protein AURDEDRAFT_168447 [Auricularia subglabra TFB-10046 SS5]